uniref:Protein KTI12 homolog n=1 Tax=Nothobranchius korthausae TaxID=1143690 RepID=A0A1A8FKK4_9TELE
MPLIVMCGYPCSGKTRRANELKAHFEEKTEREVHIVGDAALDVDRNNVYADSQKEKNVRASLKAEVERKVSKDNIVILDSLNYIKGYRYELFCLIKHTQTPHCLVYTLTSDEESSLWNKNRDAAEQYSQDTFDALVQRFEAPDSRNRWDSPLFTVLQDDMLPLEAISDALFRRKAPPPNQSTQSQPLSSANFLYELDKITQDVLMAIFNAQKTSVPGDLVSVPGATEKISFILKVNVFYSNGFLEGLTQRDL